MKTDFLSKKEQIALSLESMYNQFGFKKYKMNHFEQYSFYMENENFLDDNRLITFYSPSGTLLALKPDITMSIIKNCLKSGDNTNKIYYNESVFRVPKGSEDFKEIHQTGVEYIGEISSYQTLEILNLAVKSLATIQDDFVLCFANLALILNILNDLDLKKSQKNNIISLMQQKNIHDLTSYLESQNINDNGMLKDILMISSDPIKGLEQLEKIFGGTKYAEEVAEIGTIVKSITQIVDLNKLSLDFSHISNTEYYNGLIFTGYIKGVATPVLTGGRYDNLLSKMGGNKSALGFAVYLTYIEQLLDNNQNEIVSVKYNDNDDAVSLIKQANQLYSDGKTFCISK